jgi:hypothetical protein
MIRSCSFSFIILKGGAFMSNLINDSYYEVVPENETLDLNVLQPIDNKKKGAFMQLIGKAVKDDSGTTQGKIYLPRENVSTFLDAQGNTYALFATNKELEKMMKYAIETSNK